MAILLLKLFLLSLRWKEFYIGERLAKDVAQKNLFYKDLLNIIISNSGLKNQLSDLLKM